MIRADKEITAGLGADEVLVLVQQVFLRHIVTIPAQGHNVLIAHGRIVGGKGRLVLRLQAIGLRLLLHGKGLQLFVGQVHVTFIHCIHIHSSHCLFSAAHGLQSVQGILGQARGQGGLGRGADCAVLLHPPLAQVP